MFNNSARIHTQLICRGFMRGYSCWTKHGELELENIGDEAGGGLNEEGHEDDIFVQSPLGGD